MKYILPSIPVAFLLVACGNNTIQSAASCRPTGGTSESNQQLMLAEGSGTPAALSHLLGGFLVYDEIGLETFITTGDLKKSLAPSQKCSALLVPRMKEGRAYFDVTSAESCLRPFVWGAINQRILLSLPGTNEYQEFKIKDARALAVPSLFALMAPLPEKVRKRAVGASTVQRIATQSYYTQNYKGWEYNSPEELSFFASQCAKNNKATPVPENCLWLNGHMPDSIEVELGADNKGTFEAMAVASSAFKQASANKLDQTVSTLGKRITEYNANMQAFQPYYDEIVLSAMSTYWIGCKDAVARDTCYGTTLDERKAFALSLVKLYRPSRVAEFEAAFSSTDPVAARDILDKKYDAIVLEGVKAHLAPAVESYYEFRKEFVRRQDLISILSNHLEGTKLEPGKFSYRALSPFSSKVPEPLKGILFSFKDDNVLMTHPGAQANQNLALDGHIGSVFAFGGLPVLGFSPDNIDQSDGAALLPLPKPKTKDKQTGSSGTDESKTKTTTGEGKSDSKC
jgi:hypothetical protein